MPKVISKFHQTLEKVIERNIIFAPITLLLPDGPPPAWFATDHCRVDGVNKPGLHPLRLREELVGIRWAQLSLSGNVINSNDIDNTALSSEAKEISSLIIPFGPCSDSVMSLWL